MGFLLLRILLTNNVTPFTDIPYAKIQNHHHDIRRKNSTIT